MATSQDYGFDHDALALTDDEFQHLLQAQPEKYPEHLRIAASLDHWVATVKDRLASGEVNSLDHQRLEGLLVALPEVATALRRGQFLPGHRHGVPTEAQLDTAERAADAKLRAASEEGFNG